MPGSLSGKAFVLSAGSLLQKASTFVMVIFLVRLLDKEMYGTYQQLLYVGGITYGLFASGLAASVYYFLPRLDPNQRGRFALQTILAMAVLGAVSGMAMWGFSGHIARYVKNAALEPTLQYYAFYVFFWISSDYFLPFMNASGRYVQSIAFAVLESVLNAIALLVPLVWGAHLSGALAWLVAVGGMRYLVYVGVTFRVANVVSSKGRFNTKEQLQYSVPLMASGWADLFGNYMDKVAVSLFYPPATVAIYAIGTIKIPIWEVIAKPVNIVLRVKFAELLHAGRMAEIGPIWHEAVRKQSMAALPIVFLLWAVADRLIPLMFTNAYAESVWIIRISLLDKLLMIMSTSVFPLSMGRPDILFKGSVVFMAANALLLSVLASPLGLYGPVTALVLAQYVHAGFYVYMTLARLRIPREIFLPAATIFRVLAANVAAAVGTYLVSQAIKSPVTALVLASVTYVTIYLVLLRIFKVLHDSDVHAVLGLLSFNRKRVARRDDATEN